MDEPTSAPGMAGGPPVRPTEIRHVPAGGISAFANPDASVAPIAELPAGYELTVVGRRPPWVHVQSGDGLDGWVDGSQLAGVAVGAAPVTEPVAVPENRGPVISPLKEAVVEKKGSSFQVATGPVLGAIGGLIAVAGTAAPWLQANANQISEVDAFGVSARVLGGWDEVFKGGLELGWLIVILAGIGTLVSLISGGGIVRRILGIGIVIICAVYVLQAQDFLNSAARGLGTGLNVWDLLDYGVLVSFGGGVVMVFAPSR